MTEADDGRTRDAWASVAAVRWAAEQFEATIAPNVRAVVDLAESVEIAKVDPSLDKALTVMVNVLTGMRSAQQMLGWLESHRPIGPNQ